MLFRSVIENPGTKFVRYIYVPGLEDLNSLATAINEGKAKAASLTERIRQQKGLATAQTGAPITSTTANITTAPRPSVTTAPSPSITSTGAGENYDTVALSGMADDLSEFETKIKKLKVLRDNGILSEEEYIAEKKKLVSIF